MQQKVPVRVRTWVYACVSNRDLRKKREKTAQSRKLDWMLLLLLLLPMPTSSSGDAIGGE